MLSKSDYRYQSLLARDYAYAVSDLRPGEKYNERIPPEFDGTGLWQYERAVKDWLDLCKLDEEKRGPAMNGSRETLLSLRSHWTEKSQS